MKITVILCTHNRCESLSKALTSVVASKVADGVAWEVLVVDNNSSDRTREVAEDFAQRYPGIVGYTFEPQPGKSFALNNGIRGSQSDVFAFMDDDVIVDPTWLQNITAPFNDSAWAGTGGKILAQEGFTPPRWMALEGPYSLGSMLYAHFDLGNEAVELDRAPYGTNMAFRREMFEKYGLFRTDMGPSPGSEMRNEDTEFCRRLFAGGERLLYTPTAVVRHAIPERRVNKEFFLKWWYEYGRGKIREVGRRPNVAGLPRYVFSIPKGIAKTLLLAVKWLLTVDPQRRFFLKASVWYMTGEVVEIYTQALGRQGRDQRCLTLGRNFAHVPGCVNAGCRNE